MTTINRLAFLFIIIGPLQVFAYGDYVVPAGSSIGSADTDLNSYDITDFDDAYGKQHTTDATPNKSQVRASNAYPAATGGNRTGANLEIIPGLGSHSITIDDYTECTLDDIIMTIDGSLVDTLYEGTDWTASTSNAATCASALSAVESVSGVSNLSECVGAALYVYYEPTVYSATISSGSGPGCFTIYNGTAGTVYMRGATEVTGTLTTSQVTISPVFRSAAVEPADNTTGVGIGNAESYCFEASPAGTDVCLNADPNELVYLSGAIGFKAPLYKSANADVADISTGMALGNTEQICWEASPAGTDVCVDVTAAEAFSFTNTIGINLEQNDRIAFAAANAGLLKQGTAQTPDTMQLGLSSLSNSFLITEAADIDVDFAFPLQTNPALVIQSADSADPNKRIYLYHDQTNAVVDTQFGSISIPDGIKTTSAAIQIGTKGALTTITGEATTLTCSGGGSATLTATNLIPQYSLLLGVTSRIVVALTGSTGYELGDSTDYNLYGTASASTLGTTTNNPSASIPILQLTAGSPIVRFSGGNCTAGSVDVVAHYITLTPETSN